MQDYRVLGYIWVEDRYQLAYDENFPPGISDLIDRF